MFFLEGAVMEMWAKEIIIDDANGEVPTVPAYKASNS